MIVKLYITPACPYCYTLKEFLKENNIYFEEVDLSQDKEALDAIIKKTGQMGAPIIEIDDHVIVGFDKEKIVELLKIKK